MDYYYLFTFNTKKIKNKHVCIKYYYNNDDVCYDVGVLHVK